MSLVYLFTTGIIESLKFSEVSATKATISSAIRLLASLVLSDILPPFSSISLLSFSFIGAKLKAVSIIFSGIIAIPFSSVSPTSFSISIISPPSIIPILFLIVSFSK